MKNLIDWNRFAENITIAIAWRLPRSLVMWCAIRVGAHATQGQFSNQEVPALLFMDALKRWGAEHDEPQIEAPDSLPALTPVLAG